jgi:CubicO group peptidase (beta-lactamase class C family)
MKITSRIGVIVGLLAGAAGVLAQASMAPDLRSKVDAAVADVMARTSVPSASVGIVQGGAIVFTKAYGRARLDPPVNATAEMAYPIGSISKQFTSAALLLLQQDGKLSIDDPVAKYFPELTRAKDVTIRNLLTHTSGYEDYAPQDYTIPDWMKPTTADVVVHTWATKPLDFEPGTQYQYSNTNYNIAGLIVEKVSGEKFWPYLTRRVLKPLGLSRTIDLDTERSKLAVTGYMRNALGPLRPAILEAPGRMPRWLRT